MRAWLRKVLEVRDTPEAQARGLAIGMFFGVSALFGLQTIMAVAASHLLRGNKVLAIAATAISNPLTSFPLYGVCWAVGRTLVGGQTPVPDWSSLTSLSAVLALGPDFLLQLAVGTTVVGALAALATYVLAERLMGFLARFSGAPRRHPAVT